MISVALCIVLRTRSRSARRGRSRSRSREARRLEKEREMEERLTQNETTVRPEKRNQNGKTEKYDVYKLYVCVYIYIHIGFPYITNNFVAFSCFFKCRWNGYHLKNIFKHLQTSSTRCEMSCNPSLMCAQHSSVNFSFVASVVYQTCRMSQMLHNCALKVGFVCIGETPTRGGRGSLLGTPTFFWFLLQSCKSRQFQWFSSRALFQISSGTSPTDWRCHARRSYSHWDWIVATKCRLAVNCSLHQFAAVCPLFNFDIGIFGHFWTYQQSKNILRSKVNPQRRCNRRWWLCACTTRHRRGFPMLLGASRCRYAKHQVWNSMKFFILGAH